MGGNPLCFLYVLFCFVWVLEVATSVATTPYPFYFVFVPGVTSIWKEVQFAAFCPDFCASPKTSYLSARVRENYETKWAHAPGCYITFISVTFSDLIYRSASKNSSLQSVLFWQISAFVCICLFIFLFWCSLGVESLKISCDSS